MVWRHHCLKKHVVPTTAHLVAVSFICYICYEAKMEQLTHEGRFPSPSAPHAVHLFKLQYEFICPTSLILRTFNLRGCNLAP